MAIVIESTPEFAEVVNIAEWAVVIAVEISPAIVVAVALEVKSTSIPIRLDKRIFDTAGSEPVPPTLNQT